MVFGYAFIITMIGREMPVRESIESNLMSDENDPKVVELCPLFGRYELIAKIEAKDYDALKKYAEVDLRKVGEIEAVHLLICNDDKLTGLKSDISTQRINKLHKSLDQIPDGSLILVECYKDGREYYESGFCSKDNYKFSNSILLYRRRIGNGFDDSSLINLEDVLSIKKVSEQPEIKDVEKTSQR